MKKLIYLSLFSILSLINSFSFSVDWFDDKISVTDPETGDKYVLGKIYGQIQLKKLKSDSQVDQNFLKNFDNSFNKFAVEFLRTKNLNFQTATIKIEQENLIISINGSINNNPVMFILKFDQKGKLDFSYGDDNSPGIRRIDLKPAAPPE